MASRRAVLGASLLFALCICSFGAASASATTVYVCTPVGLGNGNLQDSMCSTPGAGGAFLTSPIKLQQKIKTTEPSKFTLTSHIAGIAVKVSCSSMSGSGVAENFVNEKKENEAKGVVSLNFTGCTAEEPAKKECVIKGGGFETSELGSLTSMATVEEPTSLELTPVSGKVIGSVVVEKCSAEALNGSFKIEGKVVATVGAKSASELEFTKTVTEAGGLTFGGGKASLVGTVHTIVNGGEGATVSIESP